MASLTPRLAAIRDLFVARGAEQYTGEPVSHLEHALQCALQAELEGADDTLICAALLHDLGHFCLPIHHLWIAASLRSSR